MANEKAAAQAPVQNTVKADNSRQLRSMLAARMQMVNEAGAMTPKMQKGFDRFNANIATVKE